MAGIWAAYNYRYYDDPEGQAPFKKMFATGKWGFFTGLVFATHDCIWVSRVREMRKVLNCTLFWVVPLTAMGVSFAAVTYCAVNIRKKDDRRNYILGATSSLAIFHSWWKNMRATSLLTIVFFMGALMKKDTMLRGQKTLHIDAPIKREVIQRRDFSISRDPRFA